METATVTDQLTEIFRKVFHDEEIVVTPELTAAEVAGWDSLSHMLMITEVEQAFSIKFSLREINKLRNVGALVSLVENKKSQS